MPAGQALDGDESRRPLTWLPKTWRARVCGARDCLTPRMGGEDAGVEETPHAGGPHQ